MSEDPSYRIICCANPDYSLAIRGSSVAFVITNPCDRYQHWFKDERHGTAIKDPDGQSAFALVNKATGEAIGHCAIHETPPLKRYNVDSCDKSVLWTMSKIDFNDYRHIRRVDDISLCFTANGLFVHDGHTIDLYTTAVPHYKNPGFLWKILEVLPSNPISLFRPSQYNTVRIHCRAKLNYNLTIAKDGITVMLVPSNHEDRYQHWIKEMAYGIPFKDEQKKESFAIVNKATGKAIKHGFSSRYLVQAVPFNRNYMDASLLWTESDSLDDGFREIRMGGNISMALHAFNPHIVNCPLVGLSNRNLNGLQHFEDGDQEWKIEDF